MRYFVASWMFMTEEQSKAIIDLPDDELIEAENKLCEEFFNALLPEKIEKVHRILLEANCEHEHLNNDEAICFMFVSDDASLYEKITEDPYALCYEITEEAYKARDLALKITVSVGTSKPENLTP